jgi:hypothetical protein
VTNQCPVIASHPLPIIDQLKSAVDIHILPTDILLSNTGNVELDGNKNNDETLSKVTVLPSIFTSPVPQATTFKSSRVSVSACSCVIVSSSHIVFASGQTTCSPFSLTSTFLNVVHTTLSAVAEVIFSVTRPDLSENSDLIIIFFTLNFWLI